MMDFRDCHYCTVTKHWSSNLLDYLFWWIDLNELPRTEFVPIW
jgi:hypothetical protein